MSIHYECRCNPCNCALGEQNDSVSSDASPSGSAAHQCNTAVDQKAIKPHCRIRCSRANKVTELPLGAHLVSTRWGYTHHGIYAGKGIVVHYAGLARGIVCGPVEEVTISRFVHNGSISIQCRGPVPFAPDEIVQRARSRLGEDQYRLVTNNCEHFSEWAQFGHSRSDQVERWLRPLADVRRALRKGTDMALRLLRVARSNDKGQQPVA